MNIFREFLKLLYTETDNPDYDESAESEIPRWVGIALMVVLITLTIAYFLVTK